MRRLVGLSTTLGLLCAGCAGDLLYFVTHTKVGISITGTGEQVTEATFGYDRFEGTYIPIEDENGNRLDEAPSVFSCSAIDNQWLGGLSIEQTFATGEAAADASKRVHQLCDTVVEKQVGRAGARK